VPNVRAIFRPVAPVTGSSSNDQFASRCRFLSSDGVLGQCSDEGRECQEKIVQSQQSVVQERKNESEGGNAEVSLRGASKASTKQSEARMLPKGASHVQPPVSGLHSVYSVHSGRARAMAARRSPLPRLSQERATAGKLLASCVCLLISVFCSQSSPPNLCGHDSVMSDHWPDAWALAARFSRLRKAVRRIKGLWRLICERI